MATPLDPSEEPPGSLDPLGTLNPAERMAEVLLPGFTVRMWRARLLTFTALAAVVADRTVSLMNDQEERRLEARLAFERLFVAGVIRTHYEDPSDYALARRLLPGSDLARAAMLAGEPLTRANFLKGQAVNGPFGVMARLARRLELVDDDGRIGRQGIGLLIAWADDERLPGVLDEMGPSNHAGVAWMAAAVKATAACLSKKVWPGGSQPIWRQLASHLRPDRPSRAERGVLVKLLETDPIRARVIGLLKEHIEVYRVARARGDRGVTERTVVRRAIRPHLQSDAVDNVIATVTSALDIYESTTALLQQAFDGLAWGLKHRGGRAEPEVLLSDPLLARHLERTWAAMAKLIVPLERSIEALRAEPALRHLAEPLARLREDALASLESPRHLADTVLQRHHYVQREKRKAPWIESDSRWTLAPGNSSPDSDTPPSWENKYLHPLKIQNAYAILSDLRQVAMENGDGQE